MFKKNFFIAEVSSNHNSNLQRCFKFIDKASEIGCDAVKFQLFKIDKLFHKSILKKKKGNCQSKKVGIAITFY